MNRGGFSKTEAAVIIARKLARVAWAIYTKQQPYDAERVLNRPSRCTVESDTISPIVRVASKPTTKQVANMPLATTPANTTATANRHKPRRPTALAET